MLLPCCLTTIACLLEPSSQDLVNLRNSRRPLRGSVTAQTDDVVVFNPFFSTHAEMVWGVQRLERKRVRSVQPDLAPREDFWQRLPKAEGSAEELCKLAEFCKQHRLIEERQVALESALRAERTHEAARKAYGADRSDRFLARDPIANRKLAGALAEWLKLEDPLARRVRTKELIKEYGLAWDETYFERAYRSQRQPRGTTIDRKLTMRNDDVQGVYTLFVPNGYDPFTPTALIVLLHGGGQDGNRVIGSGQQALSLFQGSLSGLNYIAVCPNALQAPWASAVNDPLLRALLDETEALFNIDLNRVYLAGHSMGGYGTWHFGPKYCERWAAIAPMCGGGSNGLKKLRDTNTFVYLYHGGDDPRVSPANSQETARQMLKDGNDFVYTQLPDRGHDCPGSVVAEMFAFFARKRLTIKNHVQVRPRSSFQGKQSKDEIRFFGKLASGGA